MNLARRRIIAAVIAVVAATVIVAPTLWERTPTVSDTEIRRAVAQQVTTMSIPASPIVFARAQRLPDRDGTARVVVHDCNIASRPVPLLITATWEGTEAEVIYANRPETRAPGCHDTTETLPLPADPKAVAAFVEVPVSPNAYISFSAGGAG